MNEQLKTLIAMEEKLTSHLNNLIDDMEKDSYNYNKYDIKILIGGEEFTLKYNADLHDGLESFIMEQIEIEKDLQ